MATIISFISLKGNIGKSTLARALATEASKSKMKVLLADVDELQRTSVKWNKLRNESGKGSAGDVLPFNGIDEALKDKEDYDLILLDLPARSEQLTIDAVSASNLVVQPVGVGIDELEPAVLNFNTLVQRYKVSKEKLVFVFNRVGTDKEFIDAVMYVKRAGYDFIEGFMRERPAYRIPQNKGQSVTECSHLALRKDANSLIQGIINKISTN